MVRRCTDFIEEHGVTDGVYRVSGIASNIKKLRALFDAHTAPADLASADWILQDIHCVSSVLKLFFRETPAPVLGEDMVGLREAMDERERNSDSRSALQLFKVALAKLTKVQKRSALRIENTHCLTTPTIRTAESLGPPRDRNPRSMAASRSIPPTHCPIWKNVIPQKCLARSADAAKKSD